jgi:hydrogenase nickel incorporation protein HypA/HybF
MHEATVAQSLIDVILAEAVRHRGRPVAAYVTCGPLEPINSEVLCFAFEALAKDTPCSAVKLSVEQKPLRGRCAGCGGSFDVKLGRDGPEPACPGCGSNDFELLANDPLLLERIEFEDA